ncbi:hypothetical protein AC791_10415 [Klebsiella sp. RIT-PI-d]|nr:hypothetical protein AC791_10415 [Klebsiella sp. RIT-PI-d]
MVDLSNETRQRKLMAIMPVDEVWGVGRRIGKKREAMGIKNVLQLADAYSGLSVNISTLFLSAQ